jgi:hypothetical protein
MRETSRFHFANLLRLAGALGGTVVLAGCALDLAYLETGGPPEGDAGNPLSADAPQDPVLDAASDSANEAAFDDATLDDVTVADAPGDSSTPPDATSVPEGGFPGCAKLVVPLSGTGQTTDFTINLAGFFDFTGATVRVAVYAPDAAGGFIEPYVQDMGNGYPREQLGPQPLSSFKSSWTTFTWNVSSSDAGGFDVTKVDYMGLTMEAGPSLASFEQPSTVVYVGEIVVEGATPTTGPFRFGSPSSVSASTSSTLPVDTLWLNTYDGMVSGSNLVWDPTCDYVSDAGSAGDGGGF